MPVWVTTLITVAVSALVTTIVSTIVGRYLTKRLNKRDAEELERKQQEEEERKQAIIAVLREEIKPITSTIDKLSEKIDKIGEGTLSSLRNDILTCYYKCREKGYRNDYDFQNIHDLDEAYTALDGNSFVADVMDRFDNLPTKEEFRVEAKKKTTSKKTTKKAIN